MADEAVAAMTDPAGIARTPTGEIAAQPTEPSNQTTNQDSGTTLLTAKEPAKVEGTEPSKEGEATKKDATKDTAPESYSDWKVPEGYEVTGELKTKVDGLFKGMNLSQEQGQQLMDFYVEQSKEAFQAPFDAYREMQEEWKTASENHPDLKGKIAPGGDVFKRVGSLINALPPELASDFKDLMNLTGAGNHHAFIRAIDLWAQQLTEGSHVSGNGPAKDGQSAPGAKAVPSTAQAMFPHLPSSGR